MKSLSTHINVKNDARIRYALFLPLVFAVAIVSYVMYMQTTAEANEEIQTLHLFADTITSQDFQNTEALYFQDVSGDALFNDFNTSNSAYVHAQEVVTPIADENTATTSTPIYESATSTATTTNEARVLATTTATSTTPISNATTTATSTDSTPASEEGSTTTSASTTTNPENTEDTSLLETVLDFFGLGEDDTSIATTSDQEASVTEAFPSTSTSPAEDGPATTSTLQVIPDVVPPESGIDVEGSTSTATSTLGSLWQVIKNMFSVRAVAQEEQTATSTEIVEDVVVEDVVATTSEEMIQGDTGVTTTPEVIENATSTATSSPLLDTPATTTATTTDGHISEEAVALPEPEEPVDLIPPLIEVTGNNPARIAIGDTYNDLGAIIRDVQDQYLGIKTEVNGVVTSSVQIDTSTSSVHTILYFATDAAGNTGYAERTVIVGNPTDVVIQDETSVEELFADVTDFCDGADTCIRKEITFADFGIAGVLKEQTIRNAQLRLSLAGRPHPLSDVGEEGIVVEYYHQDTWHRSGAIALDGTVSNAINGGYFLYALPIFNSWEELQTLQVRLTYENASGVVGEVYLESVWIEIHTGVEVVEEEEVVEVYKRELLLPSINEILEPIKDFGSGDVLEFKLKYKSQKNPLIRFLRNAFGGNGYELADITLIHPLHGEVEAEFEVEYGDDGEWVLRLKEIPLKMPPGKYSMRLGILEGSDVYYDEFDFYWGVLAANTNKHIYTPGEIANIHMGVVDDRGDTVCDAILELEVTSPHGNNITLPVERSGECNGNNVTDVPDYFATYATSEIGSYTLRLKHLNVFGEIVKEIISTFEVENVEHIPFVIEREGPTRIYPPALYDMTIRVTPRDDFSGIITERLPRGFVLESTDGGGEGVFEDHKTISWQVDLKAGETQEFTYVFDAPNISPYLYLLGPVELGGYSEGRMWHIASDAVSNVAWLEGYRTTSGTNLNSALASFEWATSTVDTIYFTHSTTTNPERLYIDQPGDYLVGVTLPMRRADNTNNNRSRVAVDVRVNGVKQDVGVGRSSYIRETGGGNLHTESSSHLNVLLEGLSVNDYIEIGVTGVSDTSQIATTTQGSLYVEYIGAGETVFSATSTRSEATTDLNGGVTTLVWHTKREDSGFTHTSSSTDIQIDAIGDYLVFVNVPLSTTDPRVNILGTLTLDGYELPGAQFSQGYIRDSDGDTTSSIHYGGVIQSTTTNQVLNVTVEPEANTGTVTMGGEEATIFIQELPASGVFFARGSTTEGASTEFNQSATTSIEWTVQDIIDGAVYTHNTGANSHEITVDTAGNYLLVYNDVLRVGSARRNNRITVHVNGVQVTGAETKTHYARITDSHNDVSGQLTFLLTDLSANDVITIATQAESDTTGSITPIDDATILLIQKATFDEPPQIPTLHDILFDNERIASTTPGFEFTAEDSDGPSDIRYQISWSTTTTFISSTTRTSGTDSGFVNTVSGGDSDPFNEGERIRFTIQNADALTNGETYYWRVRAQDVTGSGAYSDWSTTQSFTVDLGTDPSDWYQTQDGQFSSNTLSGVEVNGSESVQISTAANTEAMFVYAEGTNQTPRYRIWDGNAWSNEADTLDVGGAPWFVVTRAAPTRDEYIAGVLDANEDLNVMVYQASTTSWGNLDEVSDVVGTSTARAFDIAYESSSGDAVVVACYGTEAQYQTWNGSAWSATSSITLSLTGECEWILMASDPTSDELIAVFREGGDSATYEAQVWNGSSWGESITIGLMLEYENEGMAIEYEESGDQAILVVSNGADGDFAWNNWNGTNWGSNSVETAPQNELEFMYLARDEGTDRLALCYNDASRDAGYMTWDGNAWIDFHEAELTTNDRRGMAVHCQYETTSGRDGNLLYVYSNASIGEYNVFDGTTWSATATVDTMTDSRHVITRRTGEGDILTLFFDDANGRIDFSHWNGATWSSRQTIESSLPTTGLFIPESGMIAPKIFTDSSGYIVSNEIDHDWVPAQATWGDITFNTTEPGGSDVTLQVYYSNTLACDTIVPDGALAGNSSGFDQSSSPIDISGLSTTTYNRICLRANLTQSGASPTLDDWSVSWTRDPVLTQNYYRWYDNISSFTPIDAWPPGGTDLNENQAMESNGPIDPSEVVRLRMSVEATNVALATSTQSFTLQYAEGLSCSPALNWSDVGITSSSTALFRGYDNNIVGSNWYGGSWKYRHGITVQSSQVPDDQVDFPIYVDLSDLGPDFFANLNTDGGDIRVTQSDGTTELAREVVSASTTALTGELWFKANSISSTTNTTFYIYHGNATATDYANSATYGAENVWTNGFTAVFHFEEDPGGSAPQMNDSTGNNHDATTDNMGSSNQASGKIGNAVDANGSDESVIAPGFTSLGTSNQAYSIGIWFNPDTSETDGNIVGMSVNNPPGSWRVPPIALNAGFAQAISWTGSQSTALGTTTVGENLWRHSYTTWDSTNGLAIYLDGFEDNTNVQGTYSASAGSNYLHIAGDIAGGAGDEGHFDGQIDELRVYDERKPASWIRTEFLNQSTTTDFYSVLSEERVSDGMPIPSTLLSVSDVVQTYEQENDTLANYSAIEVGDDGEWDFVVQNNGASAGTNYCFRLVTDSGAVLDNYNNYPQLITNAAPEIPILTTLFTNEATSTQTPTFTFASEDLANDDVVYRIQIDDSYDFSSTVVDANTNDDGSQFTNLTTPSDKNPFTEGQIMQFSATTTLANNTTYYWRVQALDPNGSNEWSAWSTINSFTVNTALTQSTWFQTTEEQFATNDNDDTEALVTDEVGVTVPLTAGTTTSSAIDFDWGTVGNAWGSFDFNDTEGAGDIRYSLEYFSTSSTWTLIPDSALTGNSTGFDSGPVSLLGLDTDIYNQIRIRAIFTGAAPTLQDWTISWGQAVEKPTSFSLFDNAKSATDTPSFTFVSSDPDEDDLVYQFSFSTDNTFTSSTTRSSDLNAGFSNTVNGADSSPFTENQTIQYTIQPADSLTSSSTYWWRVRARDPLGGNVWSLWSDPWSFTVDESIVVSTWFQTTDEQFQTDTLTDLETTGTGSTTVATTIQEAMIVYGESTVQAPRYRLWNGASWSDEFSAQSVGAQINWLRLAAAPTRNEYVLGTLGTDGDINFQVYEASSTSWGNVTEVNNNLANADRRGFDVVYESQSGDALGVYCNGTGAEYTIWNGVTWSAPSSITLLNAGTCEWIRLAADPTSDEVIMVAKDSGGAPEYEVHVWNGSSWGNAQFVTGSSMVEDENEGISVMYEESGDQAVVAVSNGAASSFLTLNWNGTVWSSTIAVTLGDDFENGNMTRDVGDDNMALCYIDQDNDLGVAWWDGSSFQAGDEYEISGNNNHDGRPADCEFMTTLGTDGDLMIAYSDTVAGRYDTYDGSTYTGELSIATTTDSVWVQTIRTDAGYIIAAFMDDIIDDLYVSVWDGSSWSSQKTFTNQVSDTSTPLAETMAMAARVFPEFNAGTLRSTDITFSDGTGPKWGQVLWDDTTPGASDILYSVYYATNSTYALIPDSEIPGNSSGTTTSPIDLGDVDFTNRNVLQVQADFSCDSGDCPTLNDWTVEWSEGITVSGTINQYDQIASTTAGTVAVAVNGVLQAGKTGTIDANGNWSISNVTIFEDQPLTVFVDGAADQNEAVGVTVYDGIGDITGMELYERHLSLGSDDNSTTTNALIGHFDFTGSGDEDVFIEVDAGNDLYATSTGTFDDVELFVKSDNLFRPSSTTAETIYVHDMEIDGTVQLDANTLQVQGSFDNDGIFTADTSTVIFTATNTTEYLNFTDETATTTFNNIIFGQGSGSASWDVYSDLDVNNDLTINFGTLAPTSTSLFVAGDLLIGASGTYNKTSGTTTFDGSGSSTWTDNSDPKSDMGIVVIDGTAKTVTLGAHASTTDLVIGADDTFGAGVGNYDVTVFGTWTNNNVFTAGAGTVFMAATTTGITITDNTSSFYDLSFVGPGGSWAFADSIVDVNNDFVIATGTVTLPTSLLYIGGSFTNSDGFFMHNNGEVEFNGTSGGETITALGSGTLNNFYNLDFTGAGGAWSFLDTNATATQNVTMSNGSMVFPSGIFTIGGSLGLTGGSFDSNSGTTYFNSLSGQQTITTNGSDFHNVRFDDGASGGAAWFDTDWPSRIEMTIQSSQVIDDLTDFPVYVDLAHLGSLFFSAINNDGGDIRVTTSDGITEVAREVVTASTTALTGELHFLAPSISSTVDTTFYIYYGNNSANDYASTTQYGANNVWTNNYDAVYHMQEDPGGSVPQMLDSTRNGHNGEALGMTISNQTAGQIGFAVSHEDSADRVRGSGFSDLGTVNSDYALSLWFNADVGETDGNLLQVSSGSDGTGWCLPMLALNGDSVQSISWAPGQSTALGTTSVTQGQWHQVYHTWSSSNGLSVYLDGNEDNNTAQANFSASGASNYIHTGYSPGICGGDEGSFAGDIDEVRISTTTRTTAWINAEYQNIGVPTSFYSTSSVESFVRWSFTESNATSTADFEIVSGPVYFPSGVLAVGGSLDNSPLGEITHSSGTVRFFTASTGNIIDVAGDPLFNVLVDATGEVIVTTDATSTNNWTLLNAGDYEVRSGVTTEVQGLFSNNLLNANSTWSGSTLYLNSTTTQLINPKGFGDQYGILRIGSSTDISMWSSEATSTVTVEVGGSLYSMNHASSSGGLNIYGDYRKTAGIDHWSYETDFDGTDISGSPRQVTVRFADTASSTYSESAALHIIGSSTATTTITNQGSGSYGIEVSSSTIDASFYDFSNMNTAGLYLSSSTLITSLADGSFTLDTNGGSMISLATSTIDANSELQIERVSFATSSGISSGFNVTEVGGVATSYVWFRNHYGNYDGEANDNDSGSPGEIRWDDSGNTISVSGTVYENDRVTAMNAVTCDDVTAVVRVRVNGGGDHTGTCSSADGSYTVAGVSYIGDPILTIYIDDGAGTSSAAVVTKTPSGNLSGVDIYRDHVIVRHESTEALTIADMDTYDGGDDADIPYTATVGGTDTLIVEPNTALYIWHGKQFVPGGNMTLESGGSGDAQDGSLLSGTSTQLTFTTTESHSIGGSFIMDETTMFDAASSTLTFTATTTGKVLAATSTLEALVFNGTGGEWSIASSTTVTNDIALTAGTITGAGDLLVRGGDITGGGTMNMTGGTVTLETDGNLGGTTDWTLSSLTLGDGVVVATTTKAGAGNMVISGVLTISANHTLESGDVDWTLSGAGTPFVINGTFEPNGSLYTYTANASTNITATTYERLILAPTGGSPAYTMQAGTFTIDDSLTFGDGTNVVSVTADVNDPTITVGGTTTINQNATFIASSANTYSAGASWLTFGTFTHANGTVLFNASTTGHLVRASTSPFFNAIFDSVAGGWTIPEHATSTNNFTLNNAAAFTVDPSVTLEVSGQFSHGIASSTTTWTDSTLYLNSGTTYTVNTKNYGDDTYGNLLIGNNTQTRMWNSTSTTVATLGNGAHYSQDHNLTDGELYIWGDYDMFIGNEYWSYATDFDGTSLSGGDERQVDVYLADNASTTISGASLAILGSSSASTTIQAQGSGTYGLETNGGTLNAQYYVIRDINATGLTFTGSPTVSNLSNGDFLLEIDGGNMITVAGTVIDANSGQTYTNNIFATSSGVTSGANASTTGTSVGSWRFTSYSGNYGGEAFDLDLGGDPGYIIWDDSDSQITISGNVYSDEGVTPIGGPTCDGTTQNVRLRVAGAGSFTSACDAVTGAYSIASVAFAPGDVITVYLDTGGGARAANITVDPATNISNMHLYQNRVVIRHEDSDPITIDNMAVYDSSDDSDIPFTAISGVPDTLTLPPNTGLYIWNTKEFAPGGDITLNSGGSGQSQDGTLRGAQNSTFTAANGESHSIGGSLDFSSGANLISASSTFTFTATTSGKIISATSSPFYDLVFNGTGGAWSFPPGVVETVDDLTINAGTVTLPSGTTTVAGSFVNNGGSFAHNNGLLYMVATTSGKSIEAGGSDFHNVTFNGSGGGWTFQDTHATSSNNFIITNGDVSLPNGVLALGGSFENNGGTFSALSSSVQYFTSTGAETIYANDSNFGSLTFDGTGGSWVFVDQHATSSGDFVILDGSVSLATGTLAVAESFNNSGGSFSATTSSGVRLYGSGSGETIATNGSFLRNLIIDGPLGTWTLSGNATTTEHFQLQNANSFTASGFVEVQGEFTNLVGGASTTWSGSELFIRSGTNYSVNTKNAGGDSYDTLIIGSNATSTDIRLWNSTSTIYTLQGTSSIYSQDHNAVNGALHIWGDYKRESGADYWSYATDFDGTDISGSPRVVSVSLDGNATTTYSGSSLQLVGASNATTTITNQGLGNYGIVVENGTFNAQYYSFDHMSGPGLQLLGASTTVTDLSNGSFTLRVDGGSMITASSTTIDNNAGLIFDAVSFATSSGINTGFNASRDATSVGAWTFTNSYGNYDGEAFDSDGIDACGSFRWDDSACLEVSQEHFRWRNDDGGEGVPDSEWFDTDWNKRAKVLIGDTAATTTTNLQVKLTVPFDADMQADFDDLRFTDSSGTTSIDYWIESVTASTDATVWVEVPELSAGGTTTLYMYYDNSSALDGGVGTTTFALFDDFELTAIGDYSGDTSLFEIDASFNYQGSNGLGASAGNETNQTTDGVYKTGSTAGQGTTFRYFQYIDLTSGGDDEPCTLFAVQSPGSSNNNYAVCLDPFDTDQIVIAENVSSNDGSGTTLATENVTFTIGWYEVEIDWLTDNTINVTVYDDGIFFASTTATDSTHTSAGGFGFSFWAQNGGWDLFTARTYISSDPYYTFGIEQGRGGATWKAAEDTVLTNQEINQSLRARFTVYNTGANLIDQNFRLESAPKGGYASCEAVPSVSYSTVPDETGGCGVAAACMATSSQFTNLASTTNLLSQPAGSIFTQGQIVEDPSNQTGDIDIPTNHITEVEYAFRLTSNASDNAYCFRLSNAGTPLDNYANVAEVQARFDPILTNFTLNGAQDIVLTPGSTTTVYATGTVIDFNGFSDIDYATTTIYRSGVGVGCSPDENNCYEVASTSCSFSSCSGNSCELQCAADMQFFADPTDAGTYVAEDWLAEMSVFDAAGAEDTVFTLGVDVLTLRALTASSTIPYGSLAVDDDTGSYNATTTVTNDGNDNIDVSLSGTNLTFGASSIGVSNQLYATSTFTYSACGVCNSLSSTPTQLEVDLIKPTSSTTPIRDEVYWGLYVPPGVAAATHEGTNTFTAVGD